MTPIRVELPRGTVEFRNLVLDFTGTLSVDGALIPGVAARLRTLAGEIPVTVMTADTFGTARSALKDLPVAVVVIRDGEEKRRLVSDMEGAVAIGNGRNDVPMMEAAALGIAVLGPEGAASELLAAAQVVTGSILDALDLLASPLRLKATLRD